MAYRRNTSLRRPAGRAAEGKKDIRDSEIVHHSAVLLGGGAYNDATSSLALTHSSVTGNHANGQPGIGGGIYNLGTCTLDALTVIADNLASTSNDDTFP